ncbi:MAG: proline--tRNA ligase [Candidatus Margulisiibacteriota bacterium]
MRYSRFFVPTLRDVPSDAEIPSQRLALRGGYILKVAAGIYDILPLGLRVVRKIEQIIRDEMNKAGALEVFLPSMIPAELWQKSGRWQKYGKELLRVKDRSGREFCYGPTHEEVIVDLVSHHVKSYKQLPITLYQVQTKFRDEIRPRFGLMRAREFTMKDAYSFHASEASLQQTYEDMFNAYTAIYRRCGLRFRVVKADSGTIGGSASQEFMIMADTGEDAIIHCPLCDYSANIEKASTIVEKQSDKVLQPLNEVKTPEKRSVDEVSEYLKIGRDKLIKTLCYRYVSKVDIEEFSYVVICIRGDFELNETKLGNVLGAHVTALASDEELERLLQSPSGFLGPVGLPEGVQLLVDDSVLSIVNGVSGANKRDVHYEGVNPGRDFSVEYTVDVKTVRVGDRCPECSEGNLLQERGIEVGHIFKLGTKYSESMHAVYLDEHGKEQVFIMGCYGIGVGRTAMAAIEQYHDERGPLWPIKIAPFEIIIIVAKSDDVQQMALAQSLYTELLANQVDVLWDDRPDRMGVKFNDADLIGAPLRIIIGNRLTDGFVELNYRSGKKEDIPVDRLAQTILKVVAELKA